MSKIEEAITVLAELGFPRAQQNERSALSLLALLQLRENGTWKKLGEPLLGVRAILDFSRNDYQKPYAENSRESFRKESLHQFVSAGLAVQNPDAPARAPNSPKWCYQISPEARELLLSFKTPRWKAQLKRYLARAGSLSKKYKSERDLNMVRCQMPGGASFKMSPGAHSELIRDILESFAPRFAPAARVLYVGDTGNKGVIHDKLQMVKLGIDLHERGKMPDVVLYVEEKNWLFLVESVTSVGPVDGKRHAELTQLFAQTSAGLVFVTTFPNRQLMSRFLPHIAWETEVWCADDASHLIHFNGDRFLGPH